MKSIITKMTILLATAAPSAAQVNNAKTATAKVFGNCTLCKATIEKAGSSKKINRTVWDADSKMAVITYNSQKTTADAVLKKIALAGYDNNSYLAPDDAYDKLQDCCKYVRENKTATIASPATQTGNGATKDHGDHNHLTTINDQQVSQLKVVFDTYFAVKDALVKTDGSTASAKAADLLIALEAVDMSKLKTDEHVIWMKLEKQLKSDTRYIKESKDPEYQRGFFITLSSAMYGLVKSSKPAEPVYYQHCPMANDGKGANWLSKERAIKNPYYGNMMLTCGKTVETIQQ